MDYLRRLQVERPWLFWVVVAAAFWLGFKLLLFVAALVVGPFGLPGWAPLAVVDFNVAVSPLGGVVATRVGLTGAAAVC